MIEKQLLSWKEAEQEAQAAESTIRDIGQGAADPHIAALMARARELRGKADALFAAVLAALPPDRP
jgi:hypothetical protein